MKSDIAESVSVLTRTIRLASGVFAPGHLGELTQVVLFELVDAVLEESGRTERRRLRLLPSRVGGLPRSRRLRTAPTTNR